MTTIIQLTDALSLDMADANHGDARVRQGGILRLTETRVVVFAFSSNTYVLSLWAVDLSGESPQVGPRAYQNVGSAWRYEGDGIKNEQVIDPFPLVDPGYYSVTNGVRITSENFVIASSPNLGDSSGTTGVFMTNFHVNSDLTIECWGDAGYQDFGTQAHVTDGGDGERVFVFDDYGSGPTARIMEVPLSTNMTPHDVPRGNVPSEQYADGIFGAVAVGGELMYFTRGVGEANFSMARMNIQTGETLLLGEPSTWNGLGIETYSSFAIRMPGSDPVIAVLSTLLDDPPHRTDLVPADALIPIKVTFITADGDILYGQLFDRLAFHQPANENRFQRCRSISDYGSDIIMAAWPLSDGSLGYSFAAIDGSLGYGTAVFDLSPANLPSFAYDETSFYEAVVTQDYVAAVYAPYTGDRGEGGGLIDGVYLLLDNVELEESAISVEPLGGRARFLGF